jgi:hypothetical protein
VGPLFGQPGGEFPGADGADGAAIDDQRAPAHALEQALAGKEDVLDVGRIADTDDDQIAAGGQRGGRGRRRGPGLGQGLHLGCGAVPDGQVKAGL